MVTGTTCGPAGARPLPPDSGRGLGRCPCRHQVPSPSARRLRPQEPRECHTAGNGECQGSRDAPHVAYKHSGGHEAQRCALWPSGMAPPSTPADALICCFFPEFSAVSPSCSSERRAEMLKPCGGRVVPWRVLLLHETLPDYSTSRPESITWKWRPPCPRAGSSARGDKGLLPREPTPTNTKKHASATENWV